MSVKLEVTGRLGKDPYVQTVRDVEVTVISVACRRGASRATDWVTGTIWDKKLQNHVRSSYKKGDYIQAFGVLGRLGVYYDGEGKPKPGLDMFINAIGTTRPEKETHESF